MPKRAIALTTALLTASAVTPVEVTPRPEPQRPPQPESGTAPDLDATLVGLVLPARSPVLAGLPAPPVVVVPTSSVATAAPPPGPEPGSGLPKRTAATGGRTRAARDALARIRECESGSDYGARSSSGRYGGAYQMDRRTFASVGGSGDPAAAPKAEQDHRAQLLYQQRGTQPWPTCSGRA